MERNVDSYINIDSETKSEAERLFSIFGITIADAVTIFLRQSLLVGGFPFEIRTPQYNAETEAAIQEARDIMSGKIQAKVYESIEEMNADIDADIDVD
ncbi:MAG: type II toxin-antitoxin system RelB/DinJ family antitoxin [Oscillospiraceae bacterium]|nr:type II toxin-antitoxin system RelB/DinJ family antitoxin [Oscillospiraceae bacterium]